MSRQCAHCLEGGAKSFCSKCRTTRYCSLECQRADWPLHKKACDNLAKSVDDEDRLLQKTDFGAIQASIMFYFKMRKGTPYETLTHFRPGNYTVVISPDGLSYFQNVLPVPGAFDVTYRRYNKTVPARPGEESGFRVYAFINKPYKATGAASTWYFGPEVLEEMQRLFDEQ